MASGSINVKLSGRLQEHIQQQIGEDGLYEDAGEYIRTLIRNDLKSRDEAWSWLRDELAAGMRAGDEEFEAVTAEEVIARNQARDR